MPARSVNDRFIANLKQQAPEFTDDEIQTLKNNCVMFEYFRRPNHCGGAMSLQDNPEFRELSDGRFVGWKDVKTARLLESIEYDVGQRIPDERKTLVWYHMFDNGLERYRCLPKWEKPKPKHPISGTGAQWREYFKSLGNPTEINMDETVEADHLPGYELFQVPLKDRSTTYQAAAKENSATTSAATSASAPISTPTLPSPPTTTTIPTLYDIDDTISLTPIPAPSSFGYRDYETNDDMMKSCIHPGKKRTPQEDSDEVRKAVGTRIDRNPDQIRACISRLIRFSNGQWTLDDFRRALGGYNERKKLDTFLERRGTEGAASGERLAIFQVAWEFFKKRDVLGVELPSAETMMMQAAGGGEKVGGGKRKREVLGDKNGNGNVAKELGGDEGGKRAKTGDGSVEAPIVV